MRLLNFLRLGPRHFGRARAFDRHLDQPPAIDVVSPGCAEVPGPRLQQLLQRLPVHSGPGPFRFRDDGRNERRSIGCARRIRAVAARREMKLQTRHRTGRRAPGTSAVSPEPRERVRSRQLRPTSTAVLQPTSGQRKQLRPRFPTGNCHLSSCVSGKVLHHPPSWNRHCRYLGWAGIAS